MLIRSNIDRDILISQQEMLSTFYFSVYTGSYTNVIKEAKDLVLSSVLKYTHM